ncbi:MAG: hypothetical protein V5A51_10915, partial [Bacteroidales bacterium]
PPGFGVSIAICPLSGQEAAAFKTPELNAPIWLGNKAMPSLTGFGRVRHFFYPARQLPGGATKMSSGGCRILA